MATLLYDAYPVLRHPLVCLVSFCLGCGCCFFCIEQLSSEDQIPVILHSNNEHMFTAMHRIRYDIYFNRTTFYCNITKMGKLSVLWNKG